MRLALVPRLPFRLAVTLTLTSLPGAMPAARAAGPDTGPLIDAGEPRALAAPLGRHENLYWQISGMHVLRSSALRSWTAS